MRRLGRSPGGEDAVGWSEARESVGEPQGRGFWLVWLVSQSSFSHPSQLSLSLRVSLPSPRSSRPGRGLPHRSEVSAGGSLCGSARRRSRSERPRRCGRWRGHKNLVFWSSLSFGANSSRREGPRGGGQAGESGGAGAGGEEEDGGAGTIRRERTLVGQVKM